MKNYLAKRFSNQGSLKNDSQDYSLSNNNITAGEYMNFFKDLSYKKVLELISQYPDYRYPKLIKMLQKYYKINELVLGCGSEDLIIRINKILNIRGGIGILVPCFYRIYETTDKFIPLAYSYRLDSELLDLSQIEKKIDKNIKSLWITNPNPVIGKYFLKADLLKMILRNKKVLFIIDESAIDFIKDNNKFSLIREAQTLPNLIVIRSFSKLHGLAGLRVGFATGKNKVLKNVEKIGLTFPVNSIAEYIVMKILEKKDFEKIIRDKIIANKEKIYKLFAKSKNIKISKSVTNCIFFRIKNKVTILELARFGIIGLDLKEQKGIKEKNFVRIPVDSSSHVFKDLFIKLEKLVNSI